MGNAQPQKIHKQQIIFFCDFVVALANLIKDFLPERSPEACGQQQQSQQFAPAFNRSALVDPFL